MTRTTRSADGRVVVDSRLRDRRVTVRRNEGRRRLHRVVTIAGMFVLLAVAYGLSRSPLMSVQKVTVTGSTHVDRADLLSSAHVSKGMAMTDVRPAAVSRRLAKLPWVASAKVTRGWPGDLTIAVVERVPVAKVPVGSSWSLIDATGRVLETTKSPPPGLLPISGVAAATPGQHVPAATDALAVAAGMPTALRAQIVNVNVGKGSTVKVQLVDGGFATLGRADQLATKYVALQTMLEHLPSLHSSCTIDVTVPEAPTLTPEDGCA